MKYSRIWAMPNKWTFLIPPIRQLIFRYIGDGKGWIDPFAGENSPAEITFIGTWKLRNYIAGAKQKER